MKLYCCYTESHAELFEQHFRPTVPPTFELHATKLAALRTNGDFRGPGYTECLHQKVRLVLASLTAGKPGEILVWSDVDIIFLDPGVPEDLWSLLETGSHDLLFQSEGRSDRGVNGGFYACRVNERTVAFFQAAARLLAEEPELLDQDAFNRLLTGGFEVRWSYLPFRYYLRSQGWPPPGDIVLYHANTTLGPGAVRQKIRQFQELLWLRRHGFPALVWSCVLRIPKRLARLTREQVVDRLKRKRDA